MVKHLQEWQCTVCGKKYETKGRAQACEAKVAVVYPVGCMYSTDWREDTFAVSENRVNCHENNGGSWWSKHENEDKKFVGHEHTTQDGSGQLKLDRSNRHVDLEAPSCVRMIEWLESQGIIPTVWGGQKPISLEEAREI